MTLNQSAYLKAAYPPPLRPPAPRCFLVKWDNSRARSSRPERYDWHEAYGVQFPNGRIGMDFGPCYETLADMREQFERQGQCQVLWLDEQEHAS